MVNAGNQLTADTNHTYQYDDNGNLIRKTLLATGNYTQYTYDAENRLIQVQEFAVGNPTAITTSSYRYDGLGRRIEKVANGQTARYIYDGEDILLQYDGSNVLQVTYSHGPGIDEPLCRTVVTSGVSGGVTALLASTADGLRGPLVDDTIVVNGQIYLGFITGSSFMPPVGQPIDSTSSHLPVAPIDVTAAATSGTLTVSLVDTATLSGNAPLYLVLREQATGRVLDSQLLFPARLTATSTAQPGLPTVIASTTVPVSSAVAGSTLYYHQDGLGTVTELTDTNGSVAKAYDAYGNLLESPGTVEQPYTYTGRELDQETGLYYYRARYYDPTTGKFLQQDPIGLRGGVNLYRYVRNNPSNYVDPTGRVLGLAVFIPALVEGGIQAGIAVTGVIGGSVLGQILSDLIFNKPPRDAKDPEGAKAPGKPGEADGFIDPADGEEWVRAPNGDWGWKDIEGSIWCPTGKSLGRAHGGPHWDVQLEKGGYKNIRPKK